MLPEQMNDSTQVNLAASTYRTGKSWSWVASFWAWALPSASNVALRTSLGKKKRTSLDVSDPILWCVMGDWPLMISKFPSSTGTQTFQKRQAENKSTLASWMALEPGCLLPLLISHISPPFLADTIINRSTVLGKGRVRERHERGMGERGGKRICKKNIAT